MSENSYVIGVDVGGSHILSGAIELQTGTLLGTSLFDAKIDNKASRTAIMQAWAGTINQSLKAVQGNHVLGIGFAMPGAFNYKTGVALFEGNEKYESLYDCHVPQSLGPLLISKTLKMRFLNDASSFAVGEAWKGEAAGKNKALSITLGTGFGSAFVKKGIPVTSGETVPEHGCLWHLPFQDGIGDDFFSTRWFTNSYKSLTGKEIPGVKELHDLHKKGDSVAMLLFHEFGINLGKFINIWIQRFEPDVLVMGGNISKAWDLFSTSFYQELDREKLQLEVKVSQLKEQAALLGGARLFDPDTWEKIKQVLTEF
ncbi:MAG: ROK family protein [Cytophagales bacterium]|nr:ROK family protein [Cytophagales bacterium]